MNFESGERLQPQEANPVAFQPPVPEPTFYASDIAPVIHANRAFIAVTAAAFLLIAIIVMKAIGPVYASRMVVGDAEGLPQISSGSSLLSSVAGSGLGSLLSGSTHSPLYQRFEELLTSQRVAEKIEQKHHVMQHIFYRQWDQANNQWTKPSGAVAWISSLVRDFFGMPEWTPPSVSDLTDNIKKYLSITDTKDTNLRQIEYEDRDRQFALNMLRWLYQEADNTIRQDDIVRTHNEIDYLRQELDKVTSVEHRTAITNLLEMEERRQMLLLSNAPYAATEIVPPEAPIKPAWPKIAMTIGLALLVGLLSSSLFVLWRAVRLRERLQTEGLDPAEIDRIVHTDHISPAHAIEHATRLFGRKAAF